MVAGRRGEERRGATLPRLLLGHRGLAACLEQDQDGTAKIGPLEHVFSIFRCIRSVPADCHSWCSTICCWLWL